MEEGYQQGPTRNCAVLFESDLDKGVNSDVTKFVNKK